MHQALARETDRASLCAWTAAEDTRSRSRPCHRPGRRYCRARLCAPSSWVSTPSISKEDLENEEMDTEQLAYLHADDGRQAVSITLALSQCDWPHAGSSWNLCQAVPGLPGCSWLGKALRVSGGLFPNLKTLVPKSSILVPKTSLFPKSASLFPNNTYPYS